MCCSNEYSVCKCFIFFVSLILGTVAGLLVGLVPAVLAVLPLVLTLITLISAALLIAGIVLLVYSSGNSPSQTVARCFCPLARVIIAAAALALLFSIVAQIVFIATANVIASAVLTGLAVLFFAALIVSFLCFLFCLINRLSCC